MIRLLSSACLMLTLVACSVTKYVPEGSYLLDDVRIQTDNKEVKPSDLSLYLRQHPNSKWFQHVGSTAYCAAWEMLLLSTARKKPCELLKK